jgi:hypothetical protein
MPSARCSADDGVFVLERTLAKHTLTEYAKALTPCKAPKPQRRLRIQSQQWRI